MKPLRIKKRTSQGGDVDPVSTAAAGDQSRGTVSSATETPAEAISLAPSPPPTGRPSSASSSVSTRTTATGKSRADVKFASDLDNANVEAYLEYLTRPHNSWNSARRHLAHRREIIDNHRASVVARSLASSCNTSFISSMHSEDALERSTTSSVASAPAGFPRTAANGSKTLTGTLRKGRLGGDGNAVPAPPSLLATGTASAALPPGASSGLGTASRATSSHSSVGGGQRAPGTGRGRLSRGGALSGPRTTRVSTSAGGATAPASSGPDLSVGGTHLQAGVTSLFAGSMPPPTTATGGNRSVSRDGAGVRSAVKSKAKGGRDVGSA